MIEQFDPSQIEFWHWGILGLVTLILEMMVSGFFLLWLGVAALAVALILLIVPTIPWMAQLTIWAILSLGSLLGWRLWRKKNPLKTDDSTLNRRGEQYVGRHFTLEAPIINGQGKINVDDTTWKIESDEDLAAGTKIIVIETESTVLKVKAG